MLKKIIKYLITNVVLGSFIYLLCLVKELIQTVIGQYATTSEISRLNGDTPLAISEFLINYNNNLNLIINGIIAVIAIVMCYLTIKLVLFIVEENKKYK